MARSSLTKSFFKKYFIKSSPGSKLKTSLDKLVDSTGVVIEEINNNKSQGRVLVNSENWAARSSDNSIIKVGNKISVEKIEGIKLIVKVVETPE